MRTSPICSFTLALAVLLLLVACQGLAPAATPAPTVDTAATVSAAVQATNAAQASFSATVDAAVKATSAAAAKPSPSVTTSTPARTATPTRKPVGPTATPVNYYALTEEQLAALIDQAVKEAVAATTTATTTTTTATSDGTLTTQESQATQASVVYAEEEIAQALALIQAYYDLYAQVATETLALLQAIEQDLNAMAQSLEQINQTLAQGLALAQSTLSQLQAAAAKAGAAAANVQAKAKNLSATVQNELNQRAANVLAVKPTNIPTDLRSTLQSVFTYIDTVRAALGDNKISQKELSAISLTGANATAGLKALGGGEFQNVANSINGLTQQLARGEIPKAKTSLGSLEQVARSLPTSLPGVPKPPGR